MKEATVQRRQPSGQIMGRIAESLLVRALACTFRASRQDVLRHVAAAGLDDAGPTKRIAWLLRGARDLLAGAGERAAGRLFDRYIRQYRYCGLRFTVPRDLTTLETRGRFLLRRYEIPECRLSRKYIARDASVLELGGCLGVVACLINRRLEDPRRHVVVEPHPAIVPYLEANCRRNECAFTVHQLVVSDADGATFYLRDPYIAGSSTVRTSDREITVPTTTVTRLERESGLSFDTLLIDIEGAEYAFFQENAALLQRLRAAIVELHPQIIGEAACDDIRHRLSEAGLAHRETMGGVEAWTRTG
jgi:FkbM family methyltransferase